MKNLVFLLVLTAHLSRGADADSRSFGKCPHVDAQKNFEMQKMFGSWYVIQKTSTNVPCLTYNITEKEGHLDQYLLTETFPSSKLSKLVGLGHEHHTTGELCVKDETTPAVMDLNVPLDVGTYKFTVFMTDYDNYAGVFSCKNYPLTFSTLNKWSAAILSRTPSLDIELVEKVRTRLSAYNIDPFSLSIIDQHHCKAGETGVIIQTASDAINKVSQTVDNFNSDVVKPVVHEAVDSMKTFIENEMNAGKKPKIDESASSTTVPRVDGGLNTLFENSDLAGAFDNIEKDTEHNQRKPSYLSP